MLAPSVKIFICNKMHFSKALPVLVLEMQKCLCQEKSGPYPGSRDLILDLSLQLRLLLLRHVTLAWKILLSACLK